jgi:ribosomal protein S18 acetylase RimI-like enzyme
MIIREARIEDIEDLSKVALSTAMAGKDGEEFFCNKDLISQYYCEPYIRYNSKYCFVLEENGKACGYTVGAVDSKDFFKWFNENWLIKLRVQYANSKAISDEEDRILKMLKEDVEFSTLFEEYPAHLHINISKSLQGRGVGKQLILSLLKKMSEENVKGIHLGVALTNDKAIGFYKHLGFKIIEEKTWGYYMGLKLPI